VGLAANELPPFPVLTRSPTRHATGRFDQIGGNPPNSLADTGRNSAHWLFDYDYDNERVD
jgi:hypothetical protein